MGRLRAALQSKYKDKDEDVKIHAPRNLETLELSFRGERVAKVLLLWGILNTTVTMTDAARF
jgi:cleavage and polyadenylation specificity factor subunit 3